MIVDLDSTQWPQQYSVRNPCGNVCMSVGCFFDCGFEFYSMAQQYSISNPCWHPKVDQNGHQRLGHTVYNNVFTEWGVGYTTLVRILAVIIKWMT